MMERQTEGVQTHAAARIILMTIFAIAHRGMTDVCHVDADLVLATREQMQEKQ